MADLLSAVNVEDLRTTVATSGNESAVMTEADTAYDTLMWEVVDKINVEFSLDTGVEHRMPVIACTLQMWRKLVRV